MDCLWLQLVNMCQALGHLRAEPPPAWQAAFCAAIRPWLRSLDVRGLSKLVHGAARLPLRPDREWMAELLLGEWRVLLLVGVQGCWHSFASDQGLFGARFLFSAEAMLCRLMMLVHKALSRPSVLGYSKTVHN